MFRRLLAFCLVFHSQAAWAQMIDECKQRPSAESFDLATCITPGIRSGRWNLQPLSAISAVATVNGITMYETTPLPVSSVGAEIDFGDCTGPAELVMSSSGQKTLISPETDSEVLEGAHAIYKGNGRMELAGGVGFSTSIEITAQDPHSAIMFFVLKDPPFGSGQGDITFEMLYAGPDEDDAHPYCDCRTHLRTFLDQRINQYEDILAMYQDQSLWFDPENLDPNILYDYGTYNQFALMVHDQSLSSDQVVGCFNAQLAEVGAAQSHTIAEFFAQPGRAAAGTHPTTCKRTYNEDKNDSCYPEIDLANHVRHETIHWTECRNAQEEYEGEEDFNWIKDGVVDLAESPTLKREDSVISDLYVNVYLNPGIQTFAEAEIRAYQDTLTFYRGWEEDNCTPN